MREDIRFSKNAATLTHDSARGKVKRNAGNFTRGSQLFHHEVLMTWAGIKLPLYTWIATTAVLLFALGAFTFKNHEIHLVIMRGLATVWNWVGLNPDKAVNLTLPSGQVVQGHMPMVPYHPAVQAAWATAIRITVSSMLGAAFICVPLTVWFVDFFPAPGIGNPDRETRTRRDHGEPPNTRRCDPRPQLARALERMPRSGPPGRSQGSTPRGSENANPARHSQPLSTCRIAGSVAS